jgi:hypothetical protein
MPATASSSRNGSHVDLTPDEFERRLAAYGHDPDEIRHLWDQLAAGEHEEPEPGRIIGLGPVIAVYLGLLLVVVACVALVAVYWETLGSWGVLVLAAAYLAGYLGTSEILRRRELVLPADVLWAVAVAWVCLATYAVEELAGFWPANMDDVRGIDRSVTVIAVVGLVAAAALLAFRPTPLLTQLVFGEPLDDLSPRQIGMFVLPLGLAWIATGLWLDVTRRRPYATWAHWCGLVLAGEALMAMIPKTVPGFTVIGILGALSLFFSAFVRHWSFTVVGAAGVLIATFASFGEFGRLAPLAAATVGLTLIYVGLRWSRWRESVRAEVLAHMPARGRDLVQRLAP